MSSVQRILTVAVDVAPTRTRSANSAVSTDPRVSGLIRTRGRVSTVPPTSGGSSTRTRDGRAVEPCAPNSSAWSASARVCDASGSVESAARAPRIHRACRANQLCSAVPESTLTGSPPLRGRCNGARCTGSGRSAVPRSARAGSGGEPCSNVAGCEALLANSSRDASVMVRVSWLRRSAASIESNASATPVMRAGFGAAAHAESRAVLISEFSAVRSRPGSTRSRRNHPRTP